MKPGRGAAVTTSRAGWWRLAAVLVLAAGCDLRPASGPAALREEGGTVTGRIAWEGPRPELKPHPVNKDRECCGEELPDESLLISVAGGVANVVVWVEAERGQQIPVSAAAEQVPAKVRCEARKCRLEPRVVSVWAGRQELNFGNADCCGHQWTVATIENPQRSVLPKTDEQVERFTRAENVPCPVACAIHPWEQGWVMVHDNPYVAVSDAEGRFEIKHVPPGRWKLRFWHERDGWLRSDITDGRGTVEMELADGDRMELGDVRMEIQIREER